MTDIRQYDLIIEELLKQTPSFQSVGAAGYHPGLKTMLDFDAAFGHPHHHFRSIHIAGTNGKGSVAHFMAAVMAAAGYRTGLYTSPHLVDFRERIKIVEPAAKSTRSVVDSCSGNDYHSDSLSCRMIPEDDVLAFLSSADSFISENRPSFFEITTAMAFDWFRKQNVDFAVVECGLGGRLDSTNIITPVLSIITTIGFDHKDILGDTIEKIAGEKAGIIKRFVPVVFGEMPEEAGKVIFRTACETGADAFFAPDSRGCPETELSAAVGSVDVSELDLQCSVQHLNLQIVAKSLDVLAQNGIVSTETGRIPSILDALRHAGSLTGLRGRWETLCDHPKIICDIGHNENALGPVMAQLKRTVDNLHPSNFYMIFGMAGDKDIASVIHLLPQDARYIFTNAKGSRAMPSSELRKLVVSGWKGERDDLVTGSVDEAVSLFYKLSGPDDLLYVGGSSYVVAEAIPLIDERSDYHKLKKTGR